MPNKPFSKQAKLTTHIRTEYKLIIYIPYNKAGETCQALQFRRV